MSEIVVQKYGGSSLRTTAQIKKIAQRIVNLHNSGKKVVAIVSAMGDTTNELTRLAYEVSEKPTPREMDMLLTSGERVSMSLLSLAINDLGVEAISFTGSQAGIMTCDGHSNADIKEVKPIRVEKSLKENKVVIIAGYQGVDPVSKEVTTLGRGGSDTTAVVMASHFKAERCEILKDVNGLMSVDPHICKDAQIIEHIDYDSLYELCFFGARVLHTKAIQVAQKLNVELAIGICDHDKFGTTINSINNHEFFSVNTIPNITHFKVNGSSIESTLNEFNTWLKSKCISPSHYYHIEACDDSNFSIYTPLSFENLNSISQDLSKGMAIIKSDLSLVSITLSSDSLNRVKKIIDKSSLKAYSNENFKNTVYTFVPSVEAKGTINQLHQELVILI